MVKPRAIAGITEEEDVPRIQKTSGEAYSCTERRTVQLNTGRTVSTVFTLPDRFVGLVVKASASRAEDPRVRIPLAPGIFLGSSHISDLKILALQWLPCQAPGVTGPALGLVGPVSVYCDWVRWTV